MPGKVILGAQWGDEGKGKFIDIFAGKADLVVRSQGGNNAGHTVVVNDEKYKLQLIPSGILYPDCINIIGPGVVVNPKAILGEIDGLHEKGVSTDKLFIDARCHCILPWHLELDALSEAEKAKEGTAIGTTKKGIGPTYMDKSILSGICSAVPKHADVIQPTGSPHHALCRRFSAAGSWCTHPSW